MGIAVALLPPLNIRPGTGQFVHAHPEIRVASGMIVDFQTPQNPPFKFKKMLRGRG